VKSKVADSSNGILQLVTEVSNKWRFFRKKWTPKKLTFNSLFTLREQIKKVNKNEKYYQMFIVYVHVTRTYTMNEDLIVGRALERFNQNTGFKATWKPNNDEIDGKLDLIFKVGKHFFCRGETGIAPTSITQDSGNGRKIPSFYGMEDTIFPTLEKI
jgi:hypothetical protein